MATVCAYGGILLAAVAALVACNDCLRSIPLLIVQGLMWAESVDFRFLFRVSVVPAVRFIFLVVGVVRCRVDGMLLGAVLSGIFFACYPSSPLCPLMAALVGRLSALCVLLRSLMVPVAVEDFLRA